MSLCSLMRKLHRCIPALRDLTPQSFRSVAYCAGSVAADPSTKISGTTTHVASMDPQQHSRSSDLAPVSSEGAPETKDDLGQYQALKDAGLAPPDVKEAMTIPDPHAAHNNKLPDVTGPTGYTEGNGEDA